MTRVDIEVLCPYCKGHSLTKEEKKEGLTIKEIPETRTFKRMIAVSLNLDLSMPRKLVSKNPCMYCGKQLPVTLLLKVSGKPCCNNPVVSRHYDLIPLRKHDSRMIHRKCVNCEQEVLIEEIVEVET